MLIHQHFLFKKYQQHLHFPLSIFLPYLNSNQVSDLKRTCEMIKKRAAEQKLADEKNHGEEINFLKRTNQQLKAQLEGIISQKK